MEAAFDPTIKETFKVVYDLKGTPAKLVGIVGNAPGEAKAIERAIAEHKVRTNEHEQ